jgi:hypothetical protein
VNRFEKRLLLGSAVVVAVTGFVYMGMKYGLEPAQPWDAINHPLQPLVLKLHIVSAPFLVFAIGLISARHIWAHYRENTAAGRRSGLTTALVAGPMVLTGYLIQAITQVTWLEAIAMAHIAASIVFTAGLLVHNLVAGLRSRRDGPGSGGSTRVGARQERDDTRNEVLAHERLRKKLHRPLVREVAHFRVGGVAGYEEK